MSNLRQAAQQALEALEEATTYTSSESWSPSMTKDCEAAITALRAALAEPEQEPISLNNGRLTQYPDGSIGVGTPAEPEQRPVATWENKYGMKEWQVHAIRNGWMPAPTPRKPLTYDELEPLCEAFDSYDTTQNELVEFARAIERAHGIGDSHE